MHSKKVIAVALLALPWSLSAQSSNEAAPAPAPAPAESTAPAPASDAAPAEAAQQLEIRKQELTNISQQIDQLQARAETSETVKATKDKYREAVRSEMVKAAPDMEQDINRQAQLVVELTTPPATNETAAEAPAEDPQTADTERATKLAEYRELREKLIPVEQQVQDVETVKTTRQSYFDTLIAEMERIDPKASDLLAKHRELSTTVRQLSAQATRG